MNGVFVPTTDVDEDTCEHPLSDNRSESSGSKSAIWPNGLPRSAARVAGENGPAVRRACGHAALPRRRTWRPGLPVSRARRDPATPAVSTLVCFAKAKRSRRSIRLRVPLPPLACSRRANLASKHTHMTVEAYPPDGPQISPPQGSQNFSAKVARVERSIARVRVRLL